MKIRDLEQNALILIIEDNPKDVELITHHLQNVGKNWTFLNCDNKPDFLRILSQNKPDLVISDYNLSSSFSSKEAIKMVRKISNNIPFIIVSGFIDEDKAISLIVDDKVNDYIAKDNLKRLGQSVLRELKNLQIKNELKKTEQEQKRSLKLLRAINDITTSLLDVDSLTEIANIITDKLMSHFSFEDCVIYQFDDKNNLLTQVAATGPKKLTDSTITNPLTLKLGEGIAGSVAKYKKAEIVADVLQDERYIKDLEESRSEIAVPILLNGELLGVLDSEHKEMGFYTKLHLQDLQTVAGVIATKFKAGQDRERLIISELRLSQITDNIDAAVIRYIQYSSGEGKVLYASSKTIDIYEVSSEEVLENDQLIWNQTYHKDREWVNNIYEQAIITGSNFYIEFRIITPSGKEKWVETSGTITKQDDGSVISDTFNKDITERIDIAKQIDKREALLSSITNNIPGVIIRYNLYSDNSDEIDYISKGCYDIFETTPEEIYEDSSNLWKLIYPEDAERMRPSIQESADNLSLWDFTYRIKTPSGKIKWMHASGTPEKSDDKISWYTVIIDITNEKLIEEDLKASRERLVQAQKVGKIGNWYFKPNSKEVYWSDEMYSIYERDKKLGPPPIQKITTDYYGQDQQIHNDRVNRLISQLEPFDIITELKTERDNSKFIRIQGLPKLNESGELTSIEGVVQDITENKKTDIERIENEQKLKAITDNIEGLVQRYVLYENGTDAITFISRGVENIHGITQEQAMDDPSIIWGQIFEEDLKGVQKSIEKSAQELTLWDHSWRIRHPEGKIRWLRGTGAPRKDAVSNSTVWDSIILDITKEKKFEKSLESSYERLIEAQELTKIGDWSIDMVTGETYVSPTIKHTFETETDFLMDEGITYFKEGYSRDRITFLVNEAIENGTPYVEELELVTAKGNERWVRAQGKGTFKNGKCVRLNGTLIDITEEKSLKLELEDKEQRLSAAVEGADLGVWEFDFETNSNYVNDKYLEILGYKKDEIEFTLEWFQSLIHPDDIYLIDQELVRITEGGENEIDIMIRMKAKNGSYKILRDKGRIVEFGDNRSIKRLVGTILDVTETVELQNTLQQSLDEKVLLLSEIHHRVKNNLAIVTGLLDLQSMGSDNENLKKILSETARRIKSIANVHELLYNTESFSDIPFGKYVKNLANTISETLDDKKGIINLDIDEELIININQAIPLGLLLNELITNSFKYAFDSSKKKNQIDFSLTFKDDQYLANYFDSGSGFDKSQLQKSSSLGSLLIDTLLKQLDSTFEIKTEKGFNLDFTFSKTSAGAHSNI